MAYFIDDGNALIIILGASMYIQLFLIGTGRGLKELYSHYIYLVPATSFSKIVWSNIEVVFKNSVESVIIFVIAGIISKGDPTLVVACILVRCAFALLLVSANILSMRLFKNVLSQGMLLILYFLFVIIIMVPGIVLAVVLSLLMHPSNAKWYDF